MECTITWNNVEGLMNIGNKLCVPSLQRICLNFLLTHAAGRPIKAMRIAELFEEEELYREASRFVLDNPARMARTRAQHAQQRDASQARKAVRELPHPGAKISLTHTLL
jgi:hypothetical protein